MSGEINATSSFFRKDEEVILSMEKVGMTFQGKQTVRALDNITLDVHNGEFIGILGPSGCGKTTLLSIIAGIYPPTDGLAQMEGQNITGMDWRRALIFQTPTLYPWKSVYENIAFGPRMRKLPSKLIDERVKKYIELVGLTEFTEAKPYELSGGMKQRTALARALVNEPSLILMDEPLGALDAFTRANMQVLVRDIWRKTKLTAILITHDVDEAIALCSRVIVLSDRPGRILSMFDVMLSNPLMGNPKDDEVFASSEYMSLRRKILNMISN